MNFELAKYADVMFGVLKIGDCEESKLLIRLDAGNLLRQISTNFAEFPHLKLVAATLRQAHATTKHDWRAVCSNGDALIESRRYDNLEIFDRVSGGDAFAAGFIFGLLQNSTVQTAIETGAAAGALAMTTPGDSLLASRAQVKELARGNQNAAR